MSTDTPGGPAPEQPASPRPRRLERSRFGGSGRRPERHDDDAPVSRSDPGKCPQELLEHRQARVNWRMLWTASAVILAFPVWAILLSGEARVSMKAMVDWIAWNLGWYYVLTVTLVIGFVLWVALSKEGSVRQAPRAGACSMRMSMSVRATSAMASAGTCPRASITSRIAISLTSSPHGSRRPWKRTIPRHLDPFPRRLNWPHGPRPLRLRRHRHHA